MLTSAPVWLINAAAFWLAEILVSPTPTHVEPPWVLLVALAAYCAIATVGALGVHLGSRLVARAGLHHADGAWSQHPWLAFAPGALLLLPRLLYVAPIEPRPAGTLLVLLLGSAGLLAFAWRRAVWRSRLGFWAAYACGSLALWSIALGANHIASDVPLTAPTISWSTSVMRIAVALLLMASLAMSLLGGARTAFTLGLTFLASGVVVARVVAPLSFAPLPHGGCTEGRAGGSPSIPVILIVMDTTRADHLSVYGYPRNTTPELESFAAQAVVFENAIATSSWTLPSHASLFTGLFPLRHGADRPYWLASETQPGARRPGLPLGASHLTLAEWLQDHCYDTAAVAANFGYLDPAFGLDQGFAFYDAAPNTPVEPRLLSFVHRHVWPIPWAARFWRSYRSAEQVNRVALRWLADRRSDSVLLFVNYMEPHGPWVAPGPAWEKFASEPEEPRSSVWPGPMEPAMRAAVDLYDSQLVSLDRAMGAFFDGLRRLGLYDRALIIVTADHGESLGENSVVGHGQSLQGAELSIPLLIKYPGAVRAGRDPSRVQPIDIFPTIALELGIPAPQGLEGDPIGRLDHPVLAEMYRDPRLPASKGPDYQVALYEGHRKVIVRDGERGEMFDLEQDPSESHELQAPDPSALSADRTWLLERRRSLEHALRSSPGAPAPLTPNLERALQALGYLDERTHARPK